METHSFQGLKDLLKPPSQPKPNIFTRKYLCAASLVKMELAKKFKENFLDGYESSSSKWSSLSPTCPTQPISIPFARPWKDLPQILSTMNPIKSLVENGSESKQKMMLGNEKVEETEKKRPGTLNVYWIPPPVAEGEWEIDVVS